MKKAFTDQFQELFKESFNMAQKEFFKFADAKFAQAGELLPSRFRQEV